MRTRLHKPQSDHIGTHQSIIRRKVQPKLAKNKPDDLHEQEADRAAEEVVNKSHSKGDISTTTGSNAQTKPISQTLTPRVQLKEEENIQTREEEDIQLKEPEMSTAGMKDPIGEEDPIRMQEVQTKEEENVQLNETEEVQAKEDEDIQAKESVDSAETSVPDVSLQSTKGNGSSLPPDTLSEMESGFGADFSSVKIHTDSTSEQINSDIGAQAFTHQNDVYFNTNKFDPDSKEGEFLLAHELAHTIQQGAVPVKEGESEQEDQNSSLVNESEKSQQTTQSEKQTDNAPNLASSSITAATEKSTIIEQQQTVSDILQDNTDRFSETTGEEQENITEELHNEEVAIQNDADNPENKNQEESTVIQSPVQSNNQVLQTTEITVPENFDAQTELQKLREEIAITKLLLKQNKQQRIIRINSALTAEHALIDQTAKREISTVSVKYDQAISEVRKNLVVQKNTIEKERILAIGRVRQLTYEKLDLLDISVDGKRQEMIDAGNGYAERIEQYRDQLKQYTNEQTRQQKKQLSDTAASISSKKKYSSDKNKVKLIRGDLTDMAEGTRENIQASADELKTTLDENSNVMAGEFRDEAYESAEGLGDGSSEVENSIKDIQEAIIKELTTLGEQEIKQLEENAEDAVNALLSSKKELIDGITKQASEAKKNTTETTEQVKTQLNKAEVQSNTTLDKLLADTELETAELPDELVIELLENARATKEQIEQDDHDTGEQTVVQVAKELYSMANIVIEQIKAASLSGQKTADDISLRYEQGSTQLALGIVSGFGSLEVAADTEMTKAVSEFTAGMDQVIAEAGANWDVKYADGTNELKEKTEGVLAENRKAVNETIAEMPKRAEYLWKSSKWDRFWDNVGGFFEGLWEGLKELVGFLLQVLKWVLIALAVIALVLLAVLAIAALIGSGAFLAVLGAIGAAIAAISSAIGAIMAIGWLGAAVFWVGLAVGVGFFGAAIYQASTTKGLSGRDRWKIIGKGAFELITSFEMGWIAKIRFLKAGEKAAKWKSIVGFFGNSKAAKQFVRFADNQLDLANRLIGKFNGQLDQLNQLSSKFKNGLELEQLLNKVGGNPKKLETLMTFAGNDAAKLRQGLRRMTPDQLDDAMKHYDDMGKMLEDLKVSGKDSGKFVDDLKNRPTNKESMPEVDDFTKNKKNDKFVEETDKALQRPSWRQSEKDVAKKYPDYSEQKSYKNGKEVPYGTEGSTRPDLFKEGHSIEIKNYNVTKNTGKKNLEYELIRQYNDRLKHLPSGTKQTAIIDVRGQNISLKELKILKENIQVKAQKMEIIFITN